MKLRKWTRRLIVLTALIIGLAVAVVLGGRSYLRQQLQAILTESTGAVVEIRRAELGWRQQRLHDVALSESADPATTWLTASIVTIDLSLGEILSGRSQPHAVVISGASLRLRFDEQGELLTRLPAMSPGGPVELPTPRLDIRDAELALSQAGRPPAVVRPIELVVTQEDERIQLQGRADAWLDADWTLQATLDRQTRGLRWQAHTPRVTLDSQQLRALPLVPAAALEGVRFQVATPLDLSGSFEPERPSRYRLHLEPESYQLDVANQPLQLSGGGGQLTIADGVAELRQLRANLSDGQVVLDGRLDFREQLWRGRIATTIDHIAIGALPNDWNLAGIRELDVQGTASGQGNFDIEFGQASRTVRASLEGRVENATVRGLPLDPVQVQLQLEHRVGQALPASRATGLSGQLKLEGALSEVSLEVVRQRLSPELLQTLGPLAGRLSARGTLDLPLDTINDPLTWRALANVVLSEPGLAGIAFQRASSQIDLRDGQLVLRQLQAVLDDETRVDGQLQVDLLADQPLLIVDARWTNLSSQKLAETWPAVNDLMPATPVEAVWSGTVQASVPLSRARELTAWHAEWDVQSPRVRLADVELADVSAKAQLDQGTLNFNDLQAKWHDTVLAGNLTLGLANPLNFRGQVSSDQIDVEQLLGQLSWKLPTPLKGMAGLTAELRGQLAPFSWQAQGTTTAAQLALADWSIEQIKCRWEADPRNIQLIEANAQLLGGDVNVQGTFPLGEVDAAAAHLKGSFRQIDSVQLARRLLPHLPLPAGTLADLPLPAGILADLPQSVAGRLDGTFSVDNALDDLQRTAKLQFQGLRAAAGGFDVERLSGGLSYDPGRLQFELSGETLEAQLKFDGQVQPGERQWADARLTGHLQVRDAGIPRLVRLLSPQAQWRGLQGLASADVDLDMQGPAFRPTGSGRLIVQDVTWNNQSVTRLAECDLSLVGETLRLANISTRVADGLVRGELSLNLLRFGQGRFHLQADRLDLSRLAEFSRNKSATNAMPDLAGNLSGVVRGRLGPEWHGQAQIRLAAASVGGAPFESLRTPIDWSFAPGTGNLLAKVQLSSARLARGRLSGEVSARWTGRLDLDGQLRVANAEVRTLARAVPGLNRLMSGRLSGNVAFKGTNIRSFDNLSGSFDAQLTQSQSLLLPGLDVLSTSLNLGSPAGQTFSETAAKGSFRRGIVEIERMTMESSNAQLFLDGTVTTRGRLDINVTADTAQVAAAGVLLGLLRPLDFLRRRLIFLHIGGSLRSPVVQPRTAEFIQQEIVLFFLPLTAQPY